MIHKAAHHAGLRPGNRGNAAKNHLKEEQAMAIDMKDPEVLKAIKDAAKELVDTAVEEATEGLKAKNTELLGKLKKATKDAAIDPAEHQALVEQVSELETKLTESGKALKASETKAAASQKALESEAGANHRLLVDQGLTEALLKNGVDKPVLSKAAKAMLSPQVTIKIEGDNRIAVVGDKPLSDFVSEWTKSDEGKHFVTAAVNTGGGALGGGEGTPGAKTMTRTAFDAISPGEQMAFIKSGGKPIDS